MSSFWYMCGRAAFRNEYIGRVREVWYSAVSHIGEDVKEIMKRDLGCEEKERAAIRNSRYDPKTLKM